MQSQRICAIYHQTNFSYYSYTLHSGCKSIRYITLQAFRETDIPSLPSLAMTVEERSTPFLSSAIDTILYQIGVKIHGDIWFFSKRCEEEIEKRKKLGLIMIWYNCIRLVWKFTGTFDFFEEAWRGNRKKKETGVNFDLIQLYHTGVKIHGDIRFLPGVKLQGLRELRVVLVFLLVVVVVVMWCFYLPGHLTTTFAKQLL